MQTKEVSPTQRHKSINTRPHSKVFKNLCVSELDGLSSPKHTKNASTTFKIKHKDPA
jgi:hypothetical protein